MRKFTGLLILGLVVFASTAFASPTDQQYKKGAIDFEIGSTLMSKVEGTGKIKAEIPGKSGFKTAAIVGLSDRFALQYKHGQFKTEEGTVGLRAPDNSIVNLTTYAEAKLQDINILYKLNPGITIIAGYEHSDLSYGSAVENASKSAFHLGVTGTRALDGRATLFTTLIAGNDVSLKEIGVNYKLSKDGVFKVSYADRDIKDVKLKIPPLVDAKENYSMTGMTFMYAHKF